MRLKNVTRSACVLALTASFIVPQMPSHAMAQTQQGPKNPFFDLFPEDKTNNTDGLFPTVPTVPTPGNGSGNSSGSGNGNTGGFRPGNTNKNSGSTTPANRGTGPTMGVAKVSEQYACPLFENRPHKELIASIDALTAQVKASQECSDSPSAKTIEASTKSLKESVAALQGLTDVTDINSVNAGFVEQNMTSALGAITNLTETMNNNSFLNSACGRQTMSAGKVLLSLNDLVNGFMPLALVASAANPALLPVVLGTTFATTGIKVLSTMFDDRSLDMTNPNHRLAVLQNTCQYTKVAKKVRFMQLAQSGKIEKISQELEKTVDLYRAKINKPSAELNSLLAYRQNVIGSIKGVEAQLANDRADYITVLEQTKVNNDDLMICTLSRELVNWAQDEKSFPTSAFNNLQTAANARNDRSLKLQAVTFKTTHATSMKKIVALADESSSSDSALKSCAQTGRAWITSMGQAVNLTSNLVTSTRTSLEVELNQSSEYRQFAAQYNQIRQEQITIKRVEKAMEELAKDNSIIDRSELAQKMVILKNGLFGTQRMINFVQASPPVLQWIDHTKMIHDRAISGFLISWKSLMNGAYSLTKTAQGGAYKKSANGGRIFDNEQQIKDMKLSQNLGSFSLRTLPPGSIENERACQQLEGAWLDWTASLDHLGAIQFFCDMIDPVLDVKMDTAVVTACRGNVQLNGKGWVESTVNDAKNTLAKKGFQNYANIVSAKLKELQCPVPAVSVMNE
ncbi:hypothetical protein D3C87_109740 [compost metagenome]